MILNTFCTLTHPIDHFYSNVCNAVTRKEELPLLQQNVSTFPQMLYSVVFHVIVRNKYETRNLNDIALIKRRV